MSRDPTYQDYFISDLEWAVIPPLALGQCRVWRKGNQPIAYVSWAHVDQQQLARIKAGNKLLSPLEWNCGKMKVLVDVVTPFGNKKEIIAQIKTRNNIEQPK